MYCGQNIFLKYRGLIFGRVVGEGAGMLGKVSAYKSTLTARTVEYI